MAALGAGSLAIAPSLSAAEPLAAVPRSRLDRLATGANVCLWFRFARDNSAEHFNNYISPAEAAFMARLGLKHVRLCVAPRVIMDPTSGEIIAERGKQLEAAIERFHRAGLLVMVDIHNEDRAAELNPAWQEAFVRFWGSLAARLSRFDPELTILEIINEPVFDHREQQWNTLNAPPGRRDPARRAAAHDCHLGSQLGRHRRAEEAQTVAGQERHLFVPLLRPVYLHAPGRDLDLRRRQALARRALSLESRGGKASAFRPRSRAGLEGHG